MTLCFLIKTWIRSHNILYLILLLLLFIDHSSGVKTERAARGQYILQNECKRHRGLITIMPSNIITEQLRAKAINSIQDAHRKLIIWTLINKIMFLKMGWKYDNVIVLWSIKSEIKKINKAKSTSYRTHAYIFLPRMHM